MLPSPKRVVSLVHRVWDPLKAAAGFAGRRSWERERARRIAFMGKTFPFFFHGYNCGWPPARGTERCVELALADAWLDEVCGDVCEIGAVTPYYWPGRISRIVDPADKSPRVTDRASIFELDLTGRHVLSISTVEHVGHGDYGMPVVHGAANRALQKITDEASACLITFPTGYNAELDQFVRSGDLRGAVPRYLVRTAGDWEWREEIDSGRSLVPYGPRWANGLTVIWRD